MLTLLTGKTGSGKSYQAVSLIVDALAENRKVFTNIQINIHDENYHYLDELAVKNYLDFIEKTFKNVENLDVKKEQIKNTIYFDADFFIDEAHLVGFRDKKESILNWLTLQRHFNQNVHIITQVASNIHRDYLMMFHSHIDMIPPNKRLSKGMMGFKEFEAYKGERIRTVPFKPNLDLFELYSSGKKEIGISQDVKKVAFVLSSLAVMAIVLFFMIGSLFDGDIEAPKIDTTSKGSLVVVESIDNNVTYNTTMCHTLNGCTYNGINIPFNDFINKILPKEKLDKTVILAKTKKWQIIHYYLIDS